MNKTPLPLNPLPLPRVELINLIDVLITLIAFFMLTSVFAEQRKELPLRLPQTRSEETPQPTPRLVLEVDRSNRIYYQGRLLNQDQLLGLLQAQTAVSAIVIRADRDCNYGTVVRLLDLARGQHLTRVAFEVKP